MIRNRISNILWGCFWLALGILLMGKVFDWWELNIFFPGWWTLLIIVPSAIGLIKYSFGCVSTICFILGMLMLLTYQMPQYVTTSLVWKLIVPIILVVIGANVMVRSLFISTKDAVDKNVEFHKPDYVAVFNGCNQRVTGPFYGCSVDAVFGGARIDLTNVQIDKDVVIDACSVFGGTQIFLPPSVHVRVSSVGLFGGTENRHAHGNGAVATVYVSSFCLFGGVTIR